jgi:hypothetical protein
LDSGATTSTPIGDPDAAGPGSLTANAKGQLFVLTDTITGSSNSQDEQDVVEIDPATAHVKSRTHVQTVPQGVGTAFASWGGDFYLFSAIDKTSSVTTSVTRFHPSDGSLQHVVDLPHEYIAGAAVTSCAPTETPR